jgi:hypothetical protein
VLRVVRSKVTQIGILYNRQENNTTLQREREREREIASEREREKQREKEIERFL